MNLKQIRQLIFGQDIFISHRWTEGSKNYALQLAQELEKRGLDCFIDYNEIHAGDSIPTLIQLAIKRSRMFLLIVHDDVRHSAWIPKEIALANNGRRKIIPINIANMINNIDLAAPEWEALNNRDRIEETLEAFRSATPSPDVLREIDETFTARRNKAKATKYLFITALIVLFSTFGPAGWAMYYRAQVKTETEQLQNQAQQARDQTKAANEEKISALADRDRFRGEKENAEKDRDNAKSKAIEQTKLAEEKTEIADLETKRANEEKEKAVKQTEIATEKRKEAEKQKAIADVRQLSNESSSALLQNNPKLLKQSLEKAVKANRIAEENHLNLIEPILSLRRLLSVTPKRISNPSFPLSKPLCKNFAFSTNYKSLACLSNGLVEIFDIFDTTKESKKIDFIGDLKGTDISYEPANLSVSDDGKTVALAIKKIIPEEDNYQKNCHPASNCWIVVRNIDKNPCDGKPCSTMVYDVNNIYLSPKGDLLVFSGISYGNDVDEDDKNLLTFWNINSNSKPIDLVVGSSSLKGNFSSSGRVFATAGKNGLNTVVQTFLLDNTERQYSMTERTININYNEVKDIAVDNFGENIALQANGISIWQFDSGKLKALIPIYGEGYTSALFAETADKNEIVIFNYPYKENEKKELSLSKQTWLTVGDEGSKICEDECDKILYSFTPKDKILLMPENQSLIAKAEGTTVVIIRDKNNDREIDRIDAGEIIDKFGFLENGNEIVTVSYVGTGELSEGLENRYPRKVRKWKIGFQNLKIIADEKITQFKDIK